jgi:hypothetical protein
MTRPAHEVALQAWIESVLQPLSIDPTIYSDQRTPRPGKPYATLRIISDRGLGLLEQRDPYSGGTYTPAIRSTREGTVEVQIFGAGHTDAAHLLETSLRRQSVRDALELAGVAVSHSPAGVQRLSLTSDGVVDHNDRVRSNHRSHRSLQLMADVLDTNVTVSVTVGAAPVTGTNFSVPLYLADPGSLGAGFTERVRFYTLASEVSADLTSGDITQAVSDALTAGFAQSPRTSTLAVGRIAGGVAQVSTVVIGGTSPSETDNFTVDITDDAGTWSLMDWTATGGESLQDVVDALIATVATLFPDGTRYTVEDIGSLTIQITSNVPGVSFVSASTDTSATTTMADATPTAASGDGAAEEEVQIGGTIAGDEDFTINADGYSVTYTTSGGDVAADVANALYTALDALMPAPYHVWMASADEVRIDAGSSNVPLDVVVETDSAAGTMIQSTIYSTTDPDTDLDAILAEDDGWYAFVSERKGRGMALAIAAWAETNRRVLLAQSLDPLMLSGGAEGLSAERRRRRGDGPGLGCDETAARSGPDHDHLGLCDPGRDHAGLVDHHDPADRARGRQRELLQPVPGRGRHLGRQGGQRPVPRRAALDRLGPGSDRDRTGQPAVDHQQSQPENPLH